MPKTTNFDETFKTLRDIFKPFERDMVVLYDTDSNYCLTTKHIMKNKQPLWLGGVRRGKAYVSYHLIPIYACPELQKNMSPELKKRMQGKSCFNFRSVDPQLFKELSAITKAGVAKFKQKDVLAKLGVTPK
jgi:hypothetical protein